LLKGPSVDALSEDAEEQDIVTVPPDQVLSSLVEYSAFGTLKRLILEVIAFNLTPSQIQDMGQAFRAIDKKQKGTISLEDIKGYLMNEDKEVLIPMGIEAQMNAVEKVLTEHTAHHEINYNDFVAAIMWRRIQYDEEKMQVVFEALDVHRQGFLTPESIRQVVGLDKKQEEIDCMFAEADVNNDGCIDYTDFAKSWKRYVVDVQYAPMVEKIRQEFSDRPVARPEGSQRNTSCATNRTSGTIIDTIGAAQTGIGADIATLPSGAPPVENIQVMSSSVQSPDVLARAGTPNADSKQAICTSHKRKRFEIATEAA